MKLANPKPTQKTSHYVIKTLLISDKMSINYYLTDVFPLILMVEFLHEDIFPS